MAALRGKLVIKQKVFILTEIGNKIERVKERKI